MVCCRRREGLAERRLQPATPRPYDDAARGRSIALDKNFDAIDEASLAALQADGVTEGPTLEFKWEAYGAGDDAKKEFLKDLSALANTIGGHLVIGLGEAEGAAGPIAPLSLDVDAELLSSRTLLATVPAFVRPVAGVVTVNPDSEATAWPVLSNLIDDEQYVVIADLGQPGMTARFISGPIEMWTYSALANWSRPMDAGPD